MQDLIVFTIFSVCSFIGVNCWGLLFEEAGW